MTKTRVRYHPLLAASIQTALFLICGLQKNWRLEKPPHFMMTLIPAIILVATGSSEPFHIYRSPERMERWGSGGWPAKHFMIPANSVQAHIPSYHHCLKITPWTHQKKVRKKKCQRCSAVVYVLLYTLFSARKDKPSPHKVSWKQLIPMCK